MANTLTAGDLRKVLVTQGGRWSIDPNLKDNDPIRRYSLGGDLTKAIKVTDVPRIDVTAHFKLPTANPFLQQLRASRGYLSAVSAPMGGGPSAGAGGAVDWRNRFGWPWIAKIKEQGPCESCWVFSAVGLVEAMTRIEHAVWSLRSEGDVHDGLGRQCGDTGWPTIALDWMKTNGVADPACWPYETSNEPYHPTPDRPGRTVKLGDYVTLSNVADQKAWIDNVGPLSACFTVYNDFFGYSSGVYEANPATGVAGGHCIVIVGYDDTKQAWLVRNSWGSGWGMSGYCWFGYGQADIDNNAKFGVQVPNVNPDPWTKRRQHNGGLIESGDGAMHMNFELIAKVGDGVRHYWRDNGGDGAWHQAESLANDVATTPAHTGTTYNRNFEFIYQTTSNRLHHWFFDQSGGTWNDGGVFGPPDAAGAVGFVQSTYGAPGNFEVVVRTQDGRLAHWWRIDGPPWTWQESARFGSGIAHSGATLVQRRDNGLDVVAVRTDGQMQRFNRDDAHGFVWSAAETFGSGVSSPPIMIEGAFGESDETVQGNYELVVAVGGAVQHWWRANTGDQAWRCSATFGQDVAQVVGLLEGSYGFNLEVVVARTDGQLQHYWRDGAGWHTGVIIGPGTGAGVSEPQLAHVG